LRTLEVRSVNSITPRVTRITLSGPGLAGFAPRGPAAHVKVFLPRPGESEVPRTVPGPDGPVFPPELPRPLSRTYTPRQFRVDSLELDVDVVRHGDGQVWIACEAQAVRRIRAYLLHERGLGPTQIYTRGYWQVGEENHPDHDYGEDVT